MALDNALVEALQAAVAEMDQPRAVGQRLIAWLKSLSDGEATENLQNQFYDNVLAELSVSGDADAD